ncbi:MAG: hydroxymethylbilane synthase [Candidatus Kariarchaeaceae archaeon]
MNPLRLGTRGSKLALAQANLVKSVIERELDYEVEIIKISTPGDQDKSSQLHRFQGQGVFTSTLEQALLSDEIDIAVHSLKDLPAEDNAGLTIRAYITRHNLTDLLLIKDHCLLSHHPLKVKDLSRIATGSPRRQSQLVALNPNLSILDIRGNIDTRVSRLNSDTIDGIVLASAVFERLDVTVPEGVTKIELSVDLFPSAPGQGVIAVQTRVENYKDLDQINNKETEQATRTERRILASIGGGCQRSLGLSIQRRENVWELNCSITLNEWNLSKELSVMRFQAMGDNLLRLEQDLTQRLKLAAENQEDLSDKLSRKQILIARDFQDGRAYSELLESYGAITANMGLFEYQTNYSKLSDPEIIQLWKNAKWIVLSSQRAVEFLRLIHQYHPRTGFRIAVVGASTANRVRSIGLPVHLIASGSLVSLQQMMATEKGLYPGPVLFLSGKHITGLPTTDTTRVPVYETVPKKLQLPFNPDFLVVFSSRSAKVVIDRFGKDFAKYWVAIGKSTAEFLKTNEIMSIMAKTPSPQGVLTAILEEQE